MKFEGPPTRAELTELLKKEIKRLENLIGSEKRSGDLDYVKELETELRLNNDQLSKIKEDSEDLGPENVETGIRLTPEERKEYANYMLNKNTGRTLSLQNIAPIITELEKLKLEKGSESENFREYLTKVLSQYSSHLGEDITLYRKYIGYYYKQSGEGITEFLQHQENPHDSTSPETIPTKATDPTKTPADYIAEIKRNLSENKE